MNLFNYLMAKKGHNTSVRDDLLAYLLGKRPPKEVKTATGTTISISDVTREKIVSLTLSKESTQDGIPTPENPVEVKTVKGYRNLFDKDNALIGYEINGSDGTVRLSNFYYTSDFIPVKANEKYYLQKEINIEGASNCFYDINHNFISTLRQNVGIITIPDNNNIAYMRFNGRIIQENVQLTKGTEELPYVPYGTNWIYTKVTNGTDTNYYTIPLNNNEICGIGDYKDELIVDKNGHCWLNKKAGKVVLDGINNSFASVGSTNTTNVHRFMTADIGSKLSTSSAEIIPAFCNRLISKSLDDTYVKQEGFSFLNSTHRISIYIDEISTYTLEQANEWLLTHNLELYYPLATPQLIDLNYTVDLTLFKGVNNISNSDDMDMTLKYY